MSEELTNKAMISQHDVGIRVEKMLLTKRYNEGRRDTLRGYLAALVLFIAAIIVHNPILEIAFFIPMIVAIVINWRADSSLHMKLLKLDADLVAFKTKYSYIKEFGKLN